MTVTLRDVGVPAAPDQRTRLKSIIGGSAGNLVEWYDWYVYSAFTLYFAPVFFPSGDQTAELFGGDLGIAYLGTQGDPWDAQKDMALAGLGALIAMLVTLLVNRRWQRDFNREWAESLRVKRRMPLGEVALERMVRAEGFESPTPAV